MNAVVSLPQAPEQAKWFLPPPKASPGATPPIVLPAAAVAAAAAASAATAGATAAVAAVVSAARCLLLLPLLGPPTWHLIRLRLLLSK